MVHAFVFAEGKLVERNMDLSTIPLLLRDEGLHIWVDMENPTLEESKQVLEKIFQFHPLAIDDCLAPSQLPKVEEYDGYLFIVIHAVGFTKKEEEFRTTELDLFLGKNFLVTWHRDPLQSIQSTIERCDRGAQFARGSDRVAHSILDALVDNYLPVLNEFGEDVNEVETLVLEGGMQPRIVNRVVQLKKEVVHLSKVIRPQQEVLNRFARGEFKIVRTQLIPYYRDICDHLGRYNEMADTYRDSLNSTMQLYLSMSSNHTSDVVKLLTLITVMTTPMSVISSWYGMNFTNMPEIHSHYGYVGALLLTIISTAGCLIYFKRKGWM
jgi:magnesium transporter